MDAGIISVGDELVTGQGLDTNSAWLSEGLVRVGVRVAGHVTVGDDVERIQGAIGEGLDQADLVIVTGGLGPTPDDLTRQAVAAAIGEPLEENAEALGQIQAMFERWQRPLHEANKIQALIPRGCRVVPNPRGTAPGIAYTRGSKQLFALPGVPSEMKAMFEASVVPALPVQAGGRCIRLRRLLCYGISEAKVGEILADLMIRGRNPLVGTTASQGIISVRIVAEAVAVAEADRLLDEDAAEVRKRLGRAIFGEDEATLAEAVAELLAEQAKTVATAESCTGGLLAKQLTDISGSSTYFLRGYVTYSNKAKSALLSVPDTLIEAEGAVSEAVARAMASGCKAAAGTDLAISITGIAGPTGGTPLARPVGLVYVGLARASGVEVKRMLFGEHLSRAEIRDRSCQTALNLLRIRLLDRGT